MCIFYQNINFIHTLLRVDFKFLKWGLYFNYITERYHQMKLLWIHRIHFNGLVWYDWYETFHLRCNQVSGKIERVRWRDSWIRLTVMIIKMYSVIILSYFKVFRFSRAWFSRVNFWQNTLWLTNRSDRVSLWEKKSRSNLLNWLGRFSIRRRTNGWVKYNPWVVLTKKQRPKKMVQ